MNYLEQMGIAAYTKILFISHKSVERLLKDKAQGHKLDKILLSDFCPYM